MVSEDQEAARQRDTDAVQGQAASSKPSAKSEVSSDSEQSVVRPPIPLLAKELSESDLDHWFESVLRNALQILRRPQLADQVVESCWTKLMVGLVTGAVTKDPRSYLHRAVKHAAWAMKKDPRSKVISMDDQGQVDTAVAAPDGSNGVPGSEGDMEAWRKALRAAATRVRLALTTRQCRVWCALKFARTMRETARLAGSTPRDVRVITAEIIKKARKIVLRAPPPPSSK